MEVEGDDRGGGQRLRLKVEDGGWRMEAGGWRWTMKVGKEGEG
jgi:hypothetical protein